MATPKKTVIFLGSFIIALLSGIIGFVICYNLACMISPPYFIDETTGEKFATMPIGQALISTILSVIIGALALIISYRRITKNKI